MAALLEVLFGLFGFLGVGWIYAGHVGRGFLTMVGFWLFLILFIVLGTVTLGLVLCLFIPLYLTSIAFSAMGVHRYVEQTAEAYPY